MLVGVSQRLTRSTKVKVDREGETSALKRWNIGGGGDSRVRRVCVMLNAVSVTVNVFSRGLGAG